MQEQNDEDFRDQIKKTQKKNKIGQGVAEMVE